MRLLQRFAKTLVLAFDPDAAGQAAAERFYEWEQQARDRRGRGRPAAGPGPGRPGPLRPRAAAAPRSSGRTPFLGFRVERALAAGRLDTPEGRARTAEAALAVVAEHPDELVRDQYVMEVADRCRLDVDRLRAVPARRPARRRDRRRRRGEPTPAGPSPTRTACCGWRSTPSAGAETRDLLDDVLFTDDLHLRRLARAARRRRRPARGARGGRSRRRRPAAAPGGGGHDRRPARHPPGAAPRRGRAHARRSAARGGRRSATTRAVPRRDRAGCRRSARRSKDEHRPGRDVEDQLLAWLAERSMETA